MNAELNKPASTTGSSPADGLAPVYAQYPIEVVAAEGVWLHTRDGRKSARPVRRPCRRVVGLWPQGLDEGAQRTGRADEFPDQRGADGNPCARGAKLLKFSKLPFDSVFWINSGAEANENAFKMAFKMRQAARTWPRWNRVSTGAQRPAHPPPSARRRSGTSCRARLRRELDQTPRRRGHRESRHGQHGRRHRRARAGRGRRIRHGRGISRGPAQTLRRNRRAADFRRSPMRRGPLRHSVRGQLLRRDAGHHHHGQGAG